jgi:hypothetical protein
MNKYLKMDFYWYLSLQALSIELPSNITPQQIQKFKSLSPSQQQALAQSMGVDLSDINLNNSNTNKAATPQLSLDTLVALRNKNT